MAVQVALMGVTHYPTLATALPGPHRGTSGANSANSSVVLLCQMCSALLKLMDPVVSVMITSGAVIILSLGGVRSWFAYLLMMEAAAGASASYPAYQL